MNVYLWSLKKQQGCIFRLWIYLQKQPKCFSVVFFPIEFYDIDIRNGNRNKFWKFGPGSKGKINSSAAASKLWGGRETYRQISWMTARTTVRSQGRKKKAPTSLCRLFFLSSFVERHWHYFPILLFFFLNLLHTELSPNGNEGEKLQLKEKSLKSLKKHLKGNALRQWKINYWLKKHENPKNQELNEMLKKFITI